LVLIIHINHGAFPTNELHQSLLWFLPIWHIKLWSIYPSLTHKYRRVNDITPVIFESECANYINNIPHSDSVFPCKDLLAGIDNYPDHNNH
jgi:hypothetical protein